MHKGEPNKISKCRIKINLDVTNFQANKSTAQIWVVTHIISMDSLGSFLGCHVKWGGGGGGGRGKPVVASGDVAFFISLAPSFEICFDQDQTLSVCQRSTQY